MLTLKSLPCVLFRGVCSADCSSLFPHLRTLRFWNERERRCRRLLLSLARISRDEIERLKRDGVHRAVALCLSPRKGRTTKKSQPSTPALSPLTSWRHPSQRAG
jgi:hypothetical protein